MLRSKRTFDDEPKAQKSIFGLNERPVNGIIIDMEFVVKKVREADLKANESLTFWLEKSVAERFEAVEFLRRQMYDSPTPRLQSVFKIVQYPPC